MDLYVSIVATIYHHLRNWQIDIPYVSVVATKQISADSQTNLNDYMCSRRCVFYLSSCDGPYATEKLCETS